MQGKQTYVDFEPVYKWNKEEESDILELHVQGNECSLFFLRCDRGLHVS